MDNNTSTTVNNKSLAKLSTMHNSQITEWLREHRGVVFYFSVKDFQSALSYWIIQQNQTFRHRDTALAIESYGEFILETLRISGIEITGGVFCLDKEQLEFFTSENLFRTLQSIARFNISTNQDKSDFVSLGALSHNVFYMLIREKLTQGDYL